MIKHVITFLRDGLNTYFGTQNPSNGHTEQVVVLPDGASTGQEAISLKPRAVNLVLINLEQDQVLRPPDRYTRVTVDGVAHKVNPEIRLNLFVLFVANFSDYETALESLSHVIRYFQQHSLFNHQNAPKLSQNIDQLIMELVTPSISEQHDLWSSLSLSYRPSVLYRVKTVVFRDEAPNPMPSISEIKIKIPPANGGADTGRGEQ